ncbi:S8 family serine peptidase [Hyalangium sp.]|uniref:S8 family serine peptidase n=1 Tax=Hyalangium sp. TaxID=2028555 RepID=UPI002D5F82C6|nr:S8 family serine peptidase [Hyalangium sp.]HYI01411.1 S8 family serine peptidase [Hyalangium sp.]
MSGKRNGGSQPEPDDTEYTGRYVILLPEEAAEQGTRSLGKVMGIRADVVRGDQPDELADLSTHNVFFSDIGTAVVQMDADQLDYLGMVEEKGGTPFLAVEPERIVRTLAIAGPGADGFGSLLGAPFRSEASLLLGEPVQEQPPGKSPLDGGLPAGLPLEATALQESTAAYLRGYRDSIVHLVDRLLGEGGGAEKAQLAPAVQSWSDGEATWGLHATGVTDSQYTGRGVKVAVLDTGFGPHRDFSDRDMLTACFIQGQRVADGQGHGTHCVGTACGLRAPAKVPRYGIAYEADILVGKVLGDDGSGTDSGILAGINWAVAQGAQIISMSLGALTRPGQTFSQVYEGVARRALMRGTLLIAAAGNESKRPTLITPVAHPANCPSIVAVAALDPTLNLAWFSNGGLNPNGGEVNIAAPGVDVFSSVPRPPFYRRLAGTSMATPHVAGIAALFAQATNKKGQALWQAIARSARRLPLSARDVGLGLVRAP